MLKKLVLWIVIGLLAYLTLGVAGWGNWIVDQIPIGEAVGPSLDALRGEVPANNRGPLKSYNPQRPQLSGTGRSGTPLDGVVDKALAPLFKPLHNATVVKDGWIATLSQHRLPSAKLLSASKPYFAGVTLLLLWLLFSRVFNQRPNDD